MSLHSNKLNCYSFQDMTLSSFSFSLPSELLKSLSHGDGVDYEYLAFSKKIEGIGLKILRLFCDSFWMSLNQTSKLIQNLSDFIPINFWIDYALNIEIFFHISSFSWILLLWLQMEIYVQDIAISFAFNFELINEQFLLIFING